MVRLRLESLLLIWLTVSKEAFTVAAGVARGGSASSTAAPRQKRGAKSYGVATVQAASVRLRPTHAMTSSPPPPSSPTCTDMNDGSVTDRLRTWRGGYSLPNGEWVPLNLTMVKVLLQLCLTTLNAACWLLPMKMKRFVDNKMAMSVASAFSGGVFLSLAFGHMIPHAQHGFEGMDVPNSVPYYLTLGGYMLIFFVEKVAFDTHAVMHGEEGENGSTDAVTSGRSATILLLALSVHSLFETMALGLSDSSINVLLLAMSIGLHQPAESVALLVAFLKSGLSQQRIVRMLSLFSAVGPLGMLAGIMVSQYASKIADAVLVAMAAGTFIYVGATEVIAEEFEHPVEGKWKKFGALVGGIVMIMFITSWAEALEAQAA